MQLRTFTFAALSLLALAAAPASAGPRDACKADIERFCQGVQPGGGAIAQCLKKHASELSPECRAASAEVKEEMREVHAACQGDIAAYCKDVTPGGGRILTCLQANRDRLSPTCKSEMERTRQR